MTQEKVNYISEMRNLYFGRRDTFYCIIVNDKQTNRDNKISELFGLELSDMYISDRGFISDISFARFWKDKATAMSLINTKKEKEKLSLKELTREEFLNVIPKEYKTKNYITIRNLKLRQEEESYQKSWILFRNKYKAISAYRKIIKDPFLWLSCTECGLLPLVWEYNNGRSTACGCGKDEYNHLSIHAESIMSYVSRHNGSALGYDTDELRKNWNQYVSTGKDLFLEKQQTENSIGNKIW